MRIVTWTLRLIIFLFLLAFAAKNVDPVTLNFYFDRSWQAPLVAVLFGFFTAGALFGLMAMVSVRLGQRREIQRLRREVRGHAKASEAARAAKPGRPPVVDA